MAAAAAERGLSLTAFPDLMGGDVMEHCLPYWEAFHLLQRGRGIGSDGAVQRLLYTEVMAVGEASDLVDTPSERELYVTLVYALDEEYLRWHDQERKLRAERVAPT